MSKEIGMNITGATLFVVNDKNEAFMIDFKDSHTAQLVAGLASTLKPLIPIEPVSVEIKIRKL